MDLWYYVKIYPLLLLAIAAHEAGHVLAGLLTGYPWRGVIVGPLRVARDGGTVRLSYSGMWFTGYAMYFPNPRDTRTRRAVYIAAGPAASLAFALAVAPIVFRQSWAAPKIDPLMTYLFLANAGMFLASAFPYTHKTTDRERAALGIKEFKSDAAVLVELWRDGEKWADYYAHRDEHNARYAANRALTEIAASAEAGRRPRDWDTAAMARVTGLRDGKRGEALMAHLTFYWAEDKEDPEASGRYIARAMELRGLLEDSLRDKVVLDGAYYAGFRQGDGPAARRLLEEVSAFPTPDDAEETAVRRSMLLRAEAAALFAEGKPSEAWTKAQEGLLALAGVKKSKDCSDRCLLERLIAACGPPVNGRSPE